MIFADNAKEFTNACQDLQWMHDANAPYRTGISGIVERAVRQTKGGTVTAMVRSAYPINGRTF